MWRHTDDHCHNKAIITTRSVETMNSPLCEQEMWFACFLLAVSGACRVNGDALLVHSRRQIGSWSKHTRAYIKNNGAHQHQCSSSRWRQIRLYLNRVKEECKSFNNSAWIQILVYNNLKRKWPTCQRSKSTEKRVLLRRKRKSPKSPC